MKKFLIIIGILFFSSTVLVGCEKKEAPQKLATNASANEFHVWTTQHPDFLNVTAREFLAGAGFPSVQPKVTAFENETEMQKFLVEKMAEGVSPDVIFTDTEWIYLNRKKIIALKGDPLFTPTAFDAAYVKAATEPLISEEAILGIPLSVETLALIYNSELLIDGLEDRNVPGKTWAEIKDDATKLTQTDNSFSRIAVSGIAIGDLDSTKYGVDVLKNILIQNGLDFFTEDQQNATLANQAIIGEDGSKNGILATGIEFVRSFSDSRFKQFSWTKQLIESESEKDFDAFVRGKTAMVFGYPTDVDYLKELIAKTSRSIAGKSIATALFPQNSNKSKDLLAKVKAFAVPKTARNPEVSWNFLKYMSKKKIHQKFFETTKIPTARLDLITEQAQTPLIDTFVRQAKFARTLVFPKPIPQEDFDEDLKKIFATTKFGTTQLQKVLRQYEVTLNKVLQEYWTKDELINKLIPAPQTIQK